MTKAEIAARAAIDAHDANAAEHLERLLAERLQFDGGLDAARAAADEGERRLLTAKGAPLVEEVSNALMDLGFRRRRRRFTPAACVRQTGGSSTH